MPGGIGKPSFNNQPDCSFQSQTMGITDYRYKCAFLHTITGIARISENKHLIGEEIFHRFMSCIDQSPTMFYMTVWPVCCMPVPVFWCIIYMRASRGHGCWQLAGWGCFPRLGEIAVVHMSSWDHVSEWRRSVAVVFPGKASRQLVCQGELKDVMCESQGRVSHFQSSQVGKKGSLKVLETK